MKTNEIPMNAYRNFGGEQVTLFLFAIVEGDSIHVEWCDSACNDPEILDTYESEIGSWELQCEAAITAAFNARKAMAMLNIHIAEL